MAEKSFKSGYWNLLDKTSLTQTLKQTIEEYAKGSFTGRRAMEFQI
jgi:hypothetical protein